MKTTLMLLCKITFILYLATSKIVIMKIRKVTLYILCVIVGFVSCSKDDSATDPIAVPIRDRAEQQIADKDSLLGYLGTHYYNSSTFVGNPNPSLSDLIISELADGETVPVNHTLLMDVIETKSTPFVDGDEVIDYEYYILRLNQGGGVTSPNFSDTVRVNYFGNLLDEEHFDSAVNPVDFDLLTLIPGWGRVLTEFNTSESFMVNGDGTVNYTNNGLGVMFLPSGLAFFSSSAPGVPIYSSLIFKFELFQTEINDHDGDGVPTYLEDLDNDLNLSNDDTDDDGFSNYLDGDDDNDETFTPDELEFNEYVVDTNMGEQEPVLASNEYETKRVEDNGVITINTVVVLDSNSDGTPDYLDSNVN